MPSHVLAGGRSAGIRFRRIAFLAIILVATGFRPAPSGASSDSPRRHTPGILLRTSPLSDFYFTLRAEPENDSSSTLPLPTRVAASRLRALTGYLPDSLPLKTMANTVMIVHRKNPKYAATINRLLWRRLDPGLGTLTSPEDLSRVLPEITASLQPVCGQKADSIRRSVVDLYKSAYPLYLTSTWPGHQRETTTWIREFERLFRPRAADVLAALSKELALPLADTSQVRVLVVGSGVPDDGILYASRDKSYVTVVIPARETGYRAVGRVLHWYVSGSALLSPDSSATALRVLDRALQEAKAGSALTRDLPRSLIDYAIGRTIATLFDSKDLLTTNGAETYLPAMRAVWDAHVAGGTPIESVCKEIVAAAMPPPAKP